MSITSKLARRFGFARVNTETPISQTQKTPKIPNSAVLPRLDPPGSRRPADASTPPRAAVLRRRDSTSAAPHSAASHATRRTSSDQAVLDAMRQAAPNFRRLTQSLFGHTLRRFGANADLAAALQDADLSGVPPTPGLPSAPAVLLAQALAVASDANAESALEALNALRELDLQQAVAAAWLARDGMVSSAYSTPRGTPRESNAEDDAAFVTAPSSPSGAAAAHGQSASDKGGLRSPSRSAAGTPWRLVMTLAATPAGMDVLQAVVARPVDEAHRQDFALMLKAAAAAGSDPASMLASPEAESTLTGQAVACAAARMAGNVEAARPRQWALNAVRNDLFETGPGSDFAAIDARLMKMGRWVDRAAPERARRLRNPLVGKSPFRALRHGVQNVDRGPAIARHRAARERALREAAKAMKERLVAVAPFAPGAGPGRLPQALLRAAVLEHCLQAPAPQALERHGFDEAARADIAARLAGMLLPATTDAESNAQTIEALTGQLSGLPELNALADLRLDADMLDDWLADARRMKLGPAAAAGHDEEAWLQPIASALSRAEEEVNGRDTRVPRVTRETVRSALKDIVANIEGSSRLRLGSGGIVGVGLRQITATVSAIASALFLRGRVDARLQRGRQAMFEIAMPPYDMEIMLGTQRQVAGQFGLGGSVGPDFEFAKIGPNVDALLYGQDSSDLQGVSLRLPRVGRPVPELRAEFSNLVDRLLDGSEGGTDRNRDTPLLQRLLQEFPDLTVNRIGKAGDSRRRHGLGLDFTATFGVEQGKASVSAGGSIETQRNVTRHYADASGRMRVERSIVGNTTRVVGGIKATAGVGLEVDGGKNNWDKKDVGLNGVSLGVSAERIVAGKSDRREVVYEDGRLHPLSFVETEYQKVESFLDSMQPRMDEWVEAGIDRGSLHELLGSVREHEAPTHSFAARYVMKPEARARDDVYRSSLQMSRAHPSPNAEAIAGLEAAIEAQWHDPASLRPYSVRSYERAMVQQTRGIDLVMQLGSLETAEGSHIENRLDVPARPARSTGDRT